MSVQSKSLVDAEFIRELLQPLIRFDTANPPGNEADAAHFLCDWMKKAGIEATYIEKTPQRGNVLGLIRGSKPGPTIILNGHIDTQPLGSGWTSDPCSGEVRDGRIYGRGTGDMKSGVAAMLAAGAAVARCREDLAGTVVLLASADETSGGYHGVGAVLDELAALQPDMAIVCEPTLGHISIGNRGVVWVKAHIVGKSGQAGKVGSGVNAISVAADFIGAIERDLPSSFPPNPSRFLPLPSINFGVIEGGIKANVIADSCTLIIDRRVTLDETGEDVVKPIADIARRVAESRGAEISLEQVLFVPAVEVDPGERVIAECIRAFEEIVGRPTEVRAVGGFTDAHFFVHDLGIPAINFGPWYLTPHPRGSNTDIPDEYAHTDEIILGARVYERLLHNLLGGESGHGR